MNTIKRAILVSALSITVAANWIAYAAEPDPTTWQNPYLAGQGDVALEQVKSAALERFSVAPAPGDVVVYDPHLRHDVRGSVLDFDELPFAECKNSFMGEQECLDLFRQQESQVRFGPGLFVTPTANGDELRPAFDDLLSTYIEESGHSWQEYQHETEGRLDGQRARITTKTEALHWRAGKEYQIKMYILSLDGSLLSLSDGQHAALTQAVCGGYADPNGEVVPPYGAPPDWPNPAGWPTANPTPAEHAAFCAGV